MMALAIGFAEVGAIVSITVAMTKGILFFSRSAARSIQLNFMDKNSIPFLFEFIHEPAR